MATTAKPQMTDHDQVPHVFTQYNGQQQELTFSNQEFQRRLTRARQLLSSQNLDALVLTSMHNIKYYSVFQTKQEIKVSQTQVCINKNYFISFFCKSSSYICTCCSFTYTAFA